MVHGLLEALNASEGGRGLKVLTDSGKARYLRQSEGMSEPDQTEVLRKLMLPRHEGKHWQHIQLTLQTRQRKRKLS